MTWPGIGDIERNLRSGQARETFARLEDERQPPNDTAPDQPAADDATEL